MCIQCTYTCHVYSSWAYIIEGQAKRSCHLASIWLREYVEWNSLHNHIQDVCILYVCCNNGIISQCVDTCTHKLQWLQWFLNSHNHIPHSIMLHHMSMGTIYTAVYSGPVARSRLNLKYGQLFKEGSNEGDKVNCNFIHISRKGRVAVAVTVPCTHWVINKQHVGCLDLRKERWKVRDRGSW